MTLAVKSGVKPQYNQPNLLQCVFLQDPNIVCRVFGFCVSSKHLDVIPMKNVFKDLKQVHLFGIIIIHVFSLDVLYIKPYISQKMAISQTHLVTCLHYKSFENTVGKGEIACNRQFLLFPQCFLQVLRTFCHFHLI